MIPFILLLSVLINAILLFIVVRDRIVTRRNAGLYNRLRCEEMSLNHAAALLFFKDYKIDDYQGVDIYHPFFQLADTLNSLETPWHAAKDRARHVYDALISKAETERERCLELLRERLVEL